MKVISTRSETRLIQAAYRNSSMPTSSSFSTPNTRLLDRFAIDWHNKVLLNRIKSAKPKVHTNITVKCILNSGRRKQRTQQQIDIERKNDQMTKKLTEIYGRSS